MHILFVVSILNKNCDINDSKILNGILTEKLEAFNQTKENERKRETNRVKGSPQ